MKMGVYINDNKFLILRAPKTIDFDLSRKTQNFLKDEIDFIINYNQYLTEHLIKKKTRQLLSKYYKHGNNIYEHRKQRNK